MKALTKEEIQEINKKVPYNQGVFLQPNGVPTHIKTHVIYTKWDKSGVSGGSCWDDSDPEPYYNDMPDDVFKVLDLVLEKIAPELTYLKYKKITDLIHSNDETEYEYYGNFSEWEVKYIVLSDLYDLLEITP